MKIMMKTAAVALLIGSAGIASAATRHHPHHESAYSAFSATTPQQAPAYGYREFTYDNDNEPHQTATGGPVGGIN